MVKRPKLTTESQCSMNVPLPVRPRKVCFFHVDAKKIPCICVMFPDSICPSVSLLNGEENKVDTMKYQCPMDVSWCSSVMRVINS